MIRGNMNIKFLNLFATYLVTIILLSMFNCVFLTTVYYNFTSFSFFFAQLDEYNTDLV
jgi:hypothetical protein